MAEETILGYEQSVTATAAVTSPSIPEAEKAKLTQPTATGLSVTHDIGVPSQQDTLVYSNVSYDENTYAYTVKYLENGTGKVLQTAKTGEPQAYGTEITAASEAVAITGYKYISADKATLRITDADNVLNLYYEIDDTQTKEISYTVEYYKDGVKVEGDTLTVTKTVQVLQPDTLAVDKGEIYQANKYDGYMFSKFELQDGTTSTDANALPSDVNNGEVIKIYYVPNPDDTKTLTYTVEYYQGNAKQDENFGSETVQTLEPDTIAVNEDYISVDKIKDKYKGYKCVKYQVNDGEMQTDLTTIPQEVATGTVIKIYYEIDDTQTKDLSYTVNYYKDNAKVEGDTLTVTETVQVLQPDTLTVDKSKINTTDKYAGYRLEKTEPATIPDTIKNGGVINVYYVKDDGQTKAISYTVEYYRDGVKVTGDTQTVTKTVHINDLGTLTVDKTADQHQKQVSRLLFHQVEPIADPRHGGERRGHQNLLCFGQ